MHCTAPEKRPLWFKATHALVVCLLVLASVRSLVPGLCATLAAAKERAAQAEVPPCCAERLAAEAAAPAYRAPAVPHASAPCAFCYLVLGLGHASPAAPVILPAEAIAPALPDALSAPRLAAFAAGTPSRAPPVAA